MNISYKKGSLIALLFGMLLCGFLFDSLEVILDTERTVVYQNYSIDKVLADFAGDGDLAEENYSKARMVLLAKVSAISKNYKSVTLASVSGAQEGTIKCSFSNQDIINYVKTLSEGDIVNVFGTFSISFFGNDFSVDPVKIEKAAADSVSDSVYSLLSGNAVDRRSMYVRTLADDKITYYIPAEWADIEDNITDKKLGSIEGYQYRLNELPQDAALHPESLFVCYFDNKLLKKSSDKKETTLIERAIIANILGKEANELDKFPTKKADTYYGAKYQYYQDAWQGHHVEFVFQPVNTDGIIVYLYVYNDSDHVDDIIVLMRLLEAK